MNNTTKLGLNAETEAVKFLEQKGHKVIARNVRSRFYELDIISVEDNYIVLTEVKYRKNDYFGSGIEFVDHGKVVRLQKGFRMWLAENTQYTTFQPRIDVIGIGGGGKLQHIENAIN